MYTYVCPQYRNICDIFAGRSITERDHSVSSSHFWEGLSTSRTRRCSVDGIVTARGCVDSVLACPLKVRNRNFRASPPYTSSTSSSAEMCVANAHNACRVRCACANMAILVGPSTMCVDCRMTREARQKFDSIFNQITNTKVYSMCLYFLGDSACRQRIFPAQRIVQTGVRTRLIERTTALHECSGPRQQQHSQLNCHRSQRRRRPPRRCSFGRYS